MASSAISIRGVSKRFAGHDDASGTLALARVDLEVRKGEVLMLLGPSGCGKSTLLNIIAGFLAPSEGEVLQDGALVSRPDPRRTVVFQDYALFPWKSVQENVEFGLKAKGVPKADRRRRAREVLRTVRLNGFEERYPHELSGGMKQRAAIARAIAVDPEVLLMDEPFGALDAQTRVLLQEELARISAETGMTIIFVTHSIDEAVFLGDRIVVMSARPGRIRELHDVSLSRPRLPDIRSDPEFRRLADGLWESLRKDWQHEASQVAAAV
ncbi:ABC transporter ATP-binding protein [Xanthobacter sp. VTT E-85241]|uniref:ABC transporter ATP-binding protein n=1 Tax=Roseixanthobacter finlandensis TaxID=3119922 RepID=UPI0037296729